MYYLRLLLQISLARPARRLAPVLMLLLAAPTGFSAMVIQGLTGPVTSTELSSFKSFMQGEPRPTANTYDNTLADGTAGMEAESLGLVYEINRDSQLLDLMIQYCDAFLALRNDTNTGVLMWDGSRDPVWLTKPPTNSDGSLNPQAGYAGCENNDIVGHIAYCARLILQTPSLWNTAVAVGDPRHYGATYLQRAQTYITQMDFTQDAYMLKWFIDPVTSRLTAPTSAAWTAENENVNAWNRQMMFLNGFQRLSECHQLLGDNPARVAKYDAIVSAAVNWFLSSLQPYTTNGHPVYNWTYSPTSGGSEDMTLHSTYDIWGVTRAYASGRYGLSANPLIPFANTLQYVINIATNQVSYYVNGTGTARNFIYPGWMPIANFGPCTFAIMANMDSSRVSGAAIYEALILWVKNARCQGVYPNACGGPDFAITTPWFQSVTPGSNVTAVVTLNPLSGFNGTVALSAANLPAGVTASFNPASLTGGSGASQLTLLASSSAPVGTYALGAGLTIIGTNVSGALGRTAPLTLVVGAAPKFTLSESASAQTVAAGSNSVSTVTLSSASGFTNAVALSLSGLPSGAAAAFNPPLLSNSASSTLTIATSNSTPPGAYALTLLGADGNFTNSTQMSLTVNPVSGALPAPWSDADVGGPTNAGGAGYSGGVFSVKGSGGDIWSTSDQFNYVYQSVTGDLTVTAEVTTLQSANAWSKAGVMVRESTNANAGYVGLYVTTSNGVSMQFRPGTGASAVDLARNTGPVAPYWVRLTRAGNTFTGYCSPDGLSWTLVHSTNLSLAASATAGLPVCSHDPTKLNSSTLMNVSVVTPDFAVAASPDTRVVTAGSNTTFIVSPTGTNGFGGSAVLSAALPQGVSGSFSPASITGSGTSILTVTTTNSLLPDDYTLTLTGTSGGLAHGDTVLLSIPADTDGDGIPDAWMWRYFGHPTAQAGDRSRAGDDADGDGMSNLEEYLAGTNPTNAASNLRFTALRPAGNDLALFWTVAGGRSYVLQAAPSLSDLAGFSDISPEIVVPGAGESVTNYADPGALTNLLRGFYRVRLGP